MTKNLFPSESQISSEEKFNIYQTRPNVLWLTGLSGSGKSAIARALEKKLIGMEKAYFVLDGDNIRSGINAGLSFSEEDRAENIRRISEVAKLFNEAGIAVITAFISPTQSMRDKAREIIGKDRFLEIFVNTSLEECERRDPKGLYKKARAGEIKNFTGIDSPYEAPQSPSLNLKTEGSTPNELAEEIVAYLIQNSFLKLKRAKLASLK